MKDAVPFIAMGSVLAWVVMSVPAHAKEPGREGVVACASERPITPRLVADAMEAGLKAFGSRDDLLIGNLSYLREPREAAEAASGTVLFIKGRSGWRAIVPSHEENEVGVFVAPASRRLIIVTQRQIGDPGQSFTVVRTEDDFATSTCAVLRFPRELNTPTWNGESLEVHDLDIGSRGRGVLIGSASLERTGERARTLWFSYATRDDGRSWAAPRRLSREQAAPGGTLVPATLVEAPALVEDLRAFAAVPR